MTSITIVESPQAAELQQYRFPRSKRRRIRTKWANRRENYREIPKAFRMGSKLICHPSIAENLRREFSC